MFPAYCYTMLPLVKFVLCVVFTTVQCSNLYKELDESELNRKRIESITACRNYEDDKIYPKELVESFPPKYPPILVKLSRPNMMRQNWGVQWPLGEIPYYVDPKSYNEEQSQRICDAFSYFEKSTCIRFRRLAKHPETELDQNWKWIFVTNPHKLTTCVHTKEQTTAGVQTVTLGYYCLHEGQIAHEIMHILGFPHEHNRPDRDEYIDIVWKNIKPDREKYFEKRHNDTFKFKVPYDYSSVLHYPAKAFSSNDQRTIIVKSNAKIGQRLGLSELDVQKVETVFGVECDIREQNYLASVCPIVLNEDKPNTHKIRYSDVVDYFKDRLWPKGIVYFRIDERQFSDREIELLESTFKYIESKTCVKFESTGDSDDFYQQLQKHIKEKEILLKNDKDNLDSLKSMSNNVKAKTSTNTASNQDNAKRHNYTYIKEKGHNDYNNEINSTSREQLVKVKDALILSKPKANETTIKTTYVIKETDKTAEDTNKNIDIQGTEQKQEANPTLDVIRVVMDEALNNSYEWSGLEINSDFKVGRKRRSLHNVRRRQVTDSFALMIVKSKGQECECPKSGRQKKYTVVRLVDDCFKSIGSLLHVFLHLLGLDHQEVMFDRDSYLHINWKKISPGLKNELLNTLPVAASLGFPYDYQSIMHRYLLEIYDNRIVQAMHPIWNDGWSAGHRHNLSNTDIKKIRKLYYEECQNREQNFIDTSQKTHFKTFHQLPLEF